MPYIDRDQRKTYCQEWRRRKIKEDPHFLENQNKIAKEYYWNNREKIAQYRHKRANDLKLEIFGLLGNKCSNPNCLIPNGCMDIRCLQIDHINGGGAREWKIMNSPEIYYKHILKKIKAGSKDYQLLCANCNWIKREENKELS